VVFIPNVDVWYRTLPETAINTFKGLLKSIAPNDRVLLLGISEVPIEDLDKSLTSDLFGFSRRDRFELERPDHESRFNYFERVMATIRKSPRDFPQDPRNRKKRRLPELERASPPPKREQTWEEKKAIALRDRQLKNQLKVRLNNLMENLKQKYRRFKKPVIEHEVIQRILEPPPPDPDVIVSDILPGAPPPRFRPYVEDDGTVRVEDTLTHKVYYNMDLDTIEDRFSNGYYSTPRQFLIDLEHIRHDAKLVGDKENQRKANEMLTNAEVYIADVEMDVAFVAQCEEMQQRELQRKAERAAQAERKAKEKQQKAIEAARIEGSSHGNSTETEVAIAGASHDVPIIAPKTPAPKQHGDDSQMSNGAPSDTGATIGGATQPTASNRDSSFSLYQTPVQRPMLAPSQSTQFTQMSSGPGGTVNVTRVALMDLSMIVNDASATTSGSKRTPDGTTNTNSQPHSHPYSNHSNGYTPTVDQPAQWGDFGILAKGDSQLPATQVPISSQGSSAPASQAVNMPFPYSQTDSSPASHPLPSQVWPVPPPPVPLLRCSEQLMTEVHNKFAQATSGYTVEQLEQVNAAIMDHVWKSRANYNRDEVARGALEVFEDVDRDVRSMQRLLTASGSFD
jgi:hypothetical protein